MNKKFKKVWFVATNKVVGTFNTKREAMSCARKIKSSRYRVTINPWLKEVD